MISYYISEQGRIIKIDLEKKKLFVLKEYTNNQGQWLSIRLNQTNSENDFQLRFHLSSHHFPEMKKVVISKQSLPLVADYYFITKSNHKSYFFPTEAFVKLQGLNFDTSAFNLFTELPGKDDDLTNRAMDPKKSSVSTVIFAKLKRMIGEINVFKRFNDVDQETDQLAYLMANPILLCKAAAYIKEQASYPEITPENEISTVKKLTSLANKEVQRLNHPDIWNGPIKAQMITLAQKRLEEWMEDEDMHKSPGIAARESGLLTALGTHRHPFFHFKNTIAYKSIVEKCPIIESRI